MSERWIEPAATPEQREVCRRFGAELLVPDPMQKVGVALRTLHGVPFVAMRYLPVLDTCGWYIYGGEYSEADDFFQSVHVFHLAEYCPQFLPYLALAPGWGVVLAPDYEDVWFDTKFLQE